VKEERGGDPRVYLKMFLRITYDSVPGLIASIAVWLKAEEQLEPLEGPQGSDMLQCVQILNVKI